jgi:hypothetical protein
MSKQFDDLMSNADLFGKKQLALVCTLLKQQTYLYPRLHTSAHLLI